jgi:hypothetical protein
MISEVPVPPLNVTGLEAGGHAVDQGGHAVDQGGLALCSR